MLEGKNKEEIIKKLYSRYNNQTNKKMAEHNRAGGNVRKPVRNKEGASETDKTDRQKFISRKLRQKESRNEPQTRDLTAKIGGEVKKIKVPTPSKMQMWRWDYGKPKFIK